jgi:hypothetical protein
MASSAAMILRARRAGIVNPIIAYNEARRAGLSYAVLCAVLEQESGGGHNVFGHDAVQNPVKGGKVTKERYLSYKRYRKQGLGMQGVGPMQLTYYGYQDLADQLGGCWKVQPNIRVGANKLAKDIHKYGLYGALKAYNGSDAYARQVMSRVRKWQRIL